MSLGLDFGGGGGGGSCPPGSAAYVLNGLQFNLAVCINPGKAAGAGQAGQAKTGPLFSALGLVMIVNCIDRMYMVVKIVT